MNLQEKIPNFDARTFARTHAQHGFAWLDSSIAHGELGRFSYLASHPVETRVHRLRDGDPFVALQEMLHQSQETEQHSESIPRWIGNIEYDASFCEFPNRPQQQVAKAQQTHSRDALAFCFARYDAVVRIDHQSGEARVFAENESSMKAFVTRLTHLPRPTRQASQSVSGGIEVEAPALHQQRIAEALRRITDGEVYQINLARRFVLPFREQRQGAEIDLYLRMREASPVPFGAYIEQPSQTLLSASMERFLAFDPQTRRLETRPIKGTLRRNVENPMEDGTSMRSDPKERSEHAMIVDLLRNDLSRVCEVGSVKVDEAFRIEPYAKLFHMVSVVSATKHLDTQLSELLFATFPPGSVTGTPKLSAIESIDELESCPRGAYCGAIGYFDQCGGFNFSVAIRTARFQHETKELDYFAGGGIVIQSQIDKEVAETELKARVFLESV